MFKACTWALALAAVASAVELTQPYSGTEIVPGRYIAQVRANMTDAAHASLAAKMGMKTYRIGTTFRAVAGALDDARLADLLAHEDVLMVEHDAVMRAMQQCPGLQAPPVSWGQVRTTTVVPGGTNFLYNPVWGTGVDVYVLDTGIRCSHVEFTGGRCQWGANFADSNDNDGNGHGTHCAGTIGGQTYGLAKNASLIAVKVLTDEGSGTVEGIVGGCQWASNRTATTGKPSVMSFSLGGVLNNALDNAVNAMVNAGAHVSVASGNSNVGACYFSPARAALPVTVSATTVVTTGTTSVDSKASYSNWGQCVDIWAPGTSITSAGIASDTAYATFSGTSMACPHVSGALAIHLTSQPNLTPAAAKQLLISSAIPNIIRDITDQYSPNLLLNIRC